MTTRPVPTALLGPNVAQVRPMIQAPVQAVESGIFPMPILSTRPNNIMDGSAGLTQHLSVSPTSTIVPPGRYKYCTGLANGQQGLYLAPLSNDAGNPNTKVFVPFNSNKHTSLPKVVLPPASPVIQATGLNVHSSNPIQGQTPVPTGSFMNVATMQQRGLTPGKGANTPGAILWDNLPTPVRNMKPNNVPQPVTVPLMLTLMDNPTPRFQSLPLTTVPSLAASSKLLNIAQNKVGECKTTPAKSSTLTAPTTFMNGVSVQSAGKTVTSFSTVKPIASQSRFPGTLKIIVNNPKGGVHQQIAHMTAPTTVNQGSVNVTVAPDPNSKAPGTILIPQPSKKRVSEQTLSRLGQYETADNSSALPTMATDDEKKITIKQEVKDTGYNDNEDETESFKFKIGSVFSLSSSVTMDEEFIKQEPDVIPRCEYHDAHFVILQNLDLKGLLSVDIRKFRKITGRQSCTKKCREKTVVRLCRLHKLCVKRKLESEPDDKLSLNVKDIKVEAEERHEVDIFFARCKPAPKSHKMRLFRNAQKRMKKKSRDDKLQHRGRSPVKTNNTKEVSLQKLLPKCNTNAASTDKDHSSKQDHDYANKAVSLLNPGSKPVQGWVPMTSGSSKSNTSAPSGYVTPTTTVDAKSPAVLKAASSLGTKKFYLIKVEGKNILIPVEQTGIQPRAYVLGNDKVPTTVTKNTNAVVSGNLPSLDPSQSAASIPTTVTSVQASIQAFADASAQKPFATSVTKTSVVRSQAKDDSQEVMAQKSTRESVDTLVPLLNIKPELMRGYADEEPSPAVPSTSSVNTKNTPVQAADWTPAERNLPGPSTSKAFFPGPAISTSADRIRKLKELLRKNEEELEQIKKKRKEEALEMSSILDSDDL
ncbi:uncharacterized protein LOC135478867 [Liolophura sinensis]|uniref:uncharacterized protein LOC135478867 n=1 Tax=Liolophura sinensis TaxID=3198878 RepID=UPI0031584D60